MAIQSFSSDITGFQGVQYFEMVHILARKLVTNRREGRGVGRFLFVSSVGTRTKALLTLALQRQSVALLGRPSYNRALPTSQGHITSLIG